MAARLLVVEDDPVFRRFVLAALNESRLVDVEVQTAGSVEEALEALSTQHLNCVLLDLGLPDSQGLDTVRRVLAGAGRVPVVVLTGEEEGEIAGRALEEGAQDFLEKAQLEPRSLGLAIRHAVDRGHWAAETANKTRELERRNSDLDDFAHAVSHDLRAPLRAIFHLIEEADGHLQTKDVDAASKTLAAVRPRIRRLFDMIDGVLRVTRAGRLTQSAPVEVGKLVAEVVDSLEIPPGFQVRLAQDLPTVMGEKAGLAQVFQNLIDNAIKHHPGPAGTIAVGWEDGPDEYQFTVSDDGLGIPVEQRNRIFELFLTVGAPREGNTGVGLALVRKVVQASGGTIQVEDNQPRGARFRFTLPKRPR